MSRVVIPQSDMFIPIGDHVNKIRYRIISGNRNLVSEWSVINFIEQQTLYVPPPGTGAMPPGGNPGETIIKTGPGDYDAGWVPIADALPDDIVYNDSFTLMPPGGLTDYVLTKLSDVDYDADWMPSAGGPGGTADPQDGNLVVGLSIFL